MFCDNCGCQFDDKATSCPVCGKPVNNHNMDASDSEKTVSLMDSFVQSEDDEEGTTVLTNPGNGMRMGDMNKVPPMPPMPEAPQMPPVPEVPQMPPMPEAPQMPQPPQMSDMGGMNDLAQMTMPADMNGMPPFGDMGGMPQMPPFGDMNGMPPVPPNNDMMGMPPFNDMNGMPPMPPASDNKKAKSGKKDKKKKKMSLGLKITLIAVPTVIIAALAVLAVIFVPKYTKYKDAEELLKDGSVEEAVEKYKEAGSFKDSETKVNGGAYYQYASDMMDEGKYDIAAEYFDKAALSSYEDSAEKAKECYYNVGNAKKAEGKYDEAVSAYEKAGNYSNAADCINECRYEEAVGYMNQGDYDKAIECFEKLGTYNDSAEKIKECNYRKAEALVASEEYMEAYEYFIKSEYDDYEYQANDCIYKYAKSCYADGNYEDAVINYEKVDASYKDCTKDIDECYIAIGDEALDSGDYKKAIDNYNKVEKTDVAKKVKNAKLEYVKTHKDSKDLNTMKYLGELRYAGNSEAAQIFKELVGWDIESYTNYDQEDYTTKKHEISADKDIYVHGIFYNSNDLKMDIEGYIEYSDGTKTNVISFGEIEDNYVTWVRLGGSGVKKGNTYFVVTNVSTGEIVEVYPFVIK